MRAFEGTAAYAAGFEDGKPKWIPCSERLPKESQNVLTTNRYGDYEINHIIDGDEWYWEPTPIAWMPLPEPYKGE